MDYVTEWGDRGAGARENRGGRREGKGQEAGEKCKTLILSFVNALEYFQKQEPKMLFDLHLASSETSEQTSKRSSHLDYKTGLLPVKL